MKVTFQKGRIEAFASQAAVGFHFEGDEELQPDTAAMDRASGGLISEVIQSGDFRGQLYQPSLVYTQEIIPPKTHTSDGTGQKERFQCGQMEGRRLQSSPISPG